MGTYVMTPEERRARIRSNQENKNSVASQRDTSVAKESSSNKDILSTIGDTLVNVGLGATSSIEGMVDYGAGVVGAVVGLFGDDDSLKNIEDFITWNITADLFGADAQGQGKLDTQWKNELAEKSYLEQDNLVNQVAQGVGGMLPSIAVSLIPGVGSVLSQVAFAAGAGGQSLQESLQNGNDIYKSLGYGTTAGGIELLTEQLGGWALGDSGSWVTKGLTKLGADKLIGKGIGKVGYTIVSEGLEEVLSDGLDPLNKSLWGIDNAREQYFGKGAWNNGWKEIREGLPNTFIVGGLTGVVMDGLSSGARTLKVSKDMNVNVSEGKKVSELSEKMNTMNELLTMDESVKQSKNKTQEQVDKTSTFVSKRLQTLTSESSEILKSMDESTRAKVMEDAPVLQGFFDENGNALQGTQDALQSTIDTGKASNTSSVTINVEEENNKLQKVKENHKEIFNENDTIQVDTESYDDATRKSFAKATSAISSFSKKVGKEINAVVIETSNESVKGFKDGNTLYINKTTLKDGTWARKVAHEVSHSVNGTRAFGEFYNILKQDTNAFESALKSVTKNYGFTEEQVKEAFSSINEKGYDNVSAREQEAFDELSAHIVENIFNDEDKLNILVRDNSTIAKKIYNYFKDLVASLKGTNADKETMSFLRKAVRNYERAIETDKYINQTIYNSSNRFLELYDEYSKLDESKKEEWLKANDITKEILESSYLNIKAAMELPTRFSRTKAKDIAQTSEEYAEANCDAKLVEEIKESNKLIGKFVNYENENFEGKTDKNGMPLLPEETKFSSGINKNGSYSYSVDQSTECYRQAIAKAFRNLVTNRLGRPLTARETLVSIQAAIEIGREAPCIYCYSMLDRTEYEANKIKYQGEFSNFIDYFDKQYKGDIDAFKKDYDKNIDTYVQLYLNRVLGDTGIYDMGKSIKKPSKSGKDTIRMKLWMDMYIQYGKEASNILNLEEIRNDDALVEKLKQVNKIQNASEKALQQELYKDMKQYLANASHAKGIVPYAAYTNTLKNKGILGLSKTIVKQLNSEYGLRWFSHADYHPAFLIDIMQQIIDASAKGLKGLMYCKPVEIAKIVAQTGMNVNMSCFAEYDEKTDSYIMNDKIGANWDEVKALRSQYNNIGTVMVCTSDDMVMWALSQDWIDVVIPLHTVFAGTELVEEFGLTNYKGEQSDKFVANNSAEIYQKYVEKLCREKENELGRELTEKEQKAIKSEAKGIYPPEHQNNYEKYMKALEIRGMDARFDRIRKMIVSGEANYKGKKITTSDYMKLVNETRQSSVETKALRPITKEVVEVGNGKKENVLKGSLDQLPTKGYFDYFKMSTQWNGRTMDLNDWVDQSIKDIKEGTSPADLGYGANMITKDGKRIVPTSSAQAKRYGVGGIHDNATRFSIQSLDDGTKYVVLDKNTFTDKDGNEVSPREAYNSLVGQKITLEDGDTITFVKKLPNRDMYKELFVRYPLFAREENLKAINEKINKNIVDTIEASDISLRNNKQNHEHIGIKTFDKREVYLYDNSIVYKLYLSIANLEDGSKIAYAKSRLDRANELIAKKIKEAETIGKYPSELVKTKTMDAQSSTSLGADFSASTDSLSQDESVVNNRFRFSIDEEYENAYFDGDDEKVSRIVEEQAYKKGYKYKAYHHTENLFTKFDLNRARKNMDIQGFFFSADKNAESEYGSIRYDVFLKMNNPYVVDSKSKMDAIPYKYGEENYGVKVREWLQNKGYDSVIRKAEYFGAEADEYIVFKSSQIKLSEDITSVDEYGEEIIPISKRFNSRNNDIRFSVENYSEEHYNNYGWIRANDVITSSEWSNISSQFASTNSGTKFRKSKDGFNIITSQGNTDKPHSVIALVKGTIDNPQVSRIYVIDAKDIYVKNDMEDLIYGNEQRGIQKKNLDLVGFYTNSSNRIDRYENYIEKGSRNNSYSQSNGRGNGTKTKRITGFTTNEDGSVTYTYNNGENETRFSLGATLSDERIDYLLEDNSAGDRNDYTKGFVTSISPTEFLNLTTSASFTREYFDTSMSNNYDYVEGMKKDLRQTPFLDIDEKTGKVIGHEGRHRMRQLEKQGVYGNIPIVVRFYSDGKIIKYKNGEGIDLTKIRRQNITSQFDDSFSTTIKNIIPITKNFVDDIKSTYGGDSNLRFSVEGERPSVEELVEQTREELKNKKPRKLEYNEDYTLEELNPDNRIQYEYQFVQLERDIYSIVDKMRGWQGKDVKPEDAVSINVKKDKTFAQVVSQCNKIYYKGEISALKVRKNIPMLENFFNSDNPIYVDYLNKMLADQQEEYLQAIGEAFNIIESDTFTNGKKKGGFLSLKELKALDNILAFVKNMYQSYDIYYKDGKKRTLSEDANNFLNYEKEVSKVHKNDGALAKIGGIIEEYSLNVTSPETVAHYLDGYNEKGFLTDYINRFRKDSYKKKIIEMDMIANAEEFLKKNKKYEKRLTQEAIDYNGQKVLVGEAIDIILMSTQDNGKLTLGKGGGGVEIHDKNGKKIGVLTDLMNVGKVKGKDTFTTCKLESLLNETDKQFLELVQNTYNSGTELKIEADMKTVGFTNVINGNYYSLARDTKRIRSNVGDARDQFRNAQSLNNLSINQARKERAKNIPLMAQGVYAKMVSYIDKISMYNAYAEDLQSFNKLWNYSTSDGGDSLRTAYFDVWEKSEGYIRKLLNDIQGVSTSEKSTLNKIVARVRSNYAQAALGMNIKVIASQTASYPTALLYLSPDSLAKGLFMKSNHSEMDKYCDSARVRAYEKTIVKVESLGDKVSTFGSFFTKGIQATDRLTIGQLWNACQVQIEKEMGFKVGTEKNKVEAGKLLDKVIATTQPSYTAVDKSALQRSDSEIAKSIAMFTSVAQKQFSMLVDAFGRLRYAIKTKNASMKKKATKVFRKTLASVVAANAMYAAIVQLVKHILAQDDEDDNDGRNTLQQIMKQMADSSIAMMPIVKEIYSFFANGYEIEVMSVSTMNDLLSSIKNIFGSIDDIKSGNTQQVNKALRNLFFNAGTLAGVPTRNSTKLAEGLVKRFSPETSYNWLSNFYTVSNTDISSAYNKGNTDLATSITSTLFTRYGYDVDKDTSEVISTLYSKGFTSAMASDIPSKVTIDGEEIELTAKQKEKYSLIRGNANIDAKALASLSDSAKAKALSTIYQYYNDYAKTEVLGADATKLYMFGSAIDINTLAKTIAYVNENCTGQNRKAKIQVYISKLGLKSWQKYMLMGYFGYSNSNGEAQVKAQINKLNLTKEEKKKLLEMAGY